MLTLLDGWVLFANAVRRFHELVLASGVAAVQQAYGVPEEFKRFTKSYRSSALGYWGRADGAAWRAR
jgi:hypothetical protein